MSGEKLSGNSGEEPARATGWESLSDFSGERNVNDATGKERTFSEFDLYPRMEGESSEEYGARLKQMHEMTAQYLEDEAKKEAEAKAIIGENGLRTETYENSVFGQQELSAEASYDETEAKINQAVLEGRITQENANKMLERKLEQVTGIINGARQDYKDRQAVGTEEEQQRYEDFLQSHDEENQKNLEARKAEAEEEDKAEVEDEAKNDTEATEENKEAAEMSDEEKQKQLEHDIAVVMNSFEHGHITEEDKDRMIKELTEKANGEEGAKTEAEEKAKLEEEEKAKLEEEEKAKLEEAEKLKAKADKLREEIEDLDKISSKPLVAINADFSIDRKDLAHQEAETLLNQEKTTGNYFKRLWKGTLFAKYFQKKYERQLLSGDIKTVKGQTIEDLIQERKDAALERFQLGVTEDMGYIHKEIGKQSKDGTYAKGEDIEEADEKTQEFVKSAITEFVEKAKNNKNNLSSDDLKNQFIEQFNFKVQQAKDNGEEVGVDVTNYGEVALQALELSMHGEAIENVMEGFKVYNAKVNDEIRTEAHRDAIDKIVNAFESSKIGQFIPAEVVALAASTTVSIAQMGASSVVSQLVAPVAGTLVSSAISGLRERNRITEDRAHMMRDIANGLEYGGDGTKSKSRAKYEKRIGGTLYDMRSASELTDGIKAAMETEGDGREEAILRALAEARIRRDFSDSEQKDLISFSSASQRGRERLELDKALIRAEKELPPELKERYEAMKELVHSEITDGYTNEDGEHVAGVTEQDKKFANRRALMATAKAAKTAAIGVATFFVSQEAIAAIDPNKIGIFEKAGLLKTQNNESAQETILATIGGRGNYTRVIGTDTEVVNMNDTQRMNDLSQRGYTSRVIEKPYTTTTTRIVDVDPSNSTLAQHIKVDGWANNGTKWSDGNELRMYIRNGFLESGMKGQSTMGNQVFDINTLNQANKIKAFATIGGQRFELAQTGPGQWGSGNGMFTVVGPNGSSGIVKLVGDHGEKLYEKMEFAVDNGIGADGLRHIIPLATDPVGTGVADKITQTVTEVVSHPGKAEFTMAITENVTRGITAAGIAIAPETARTGLGVATERQNEQETPRPPVEQPTQPTDNRPPVNTFGGNPEPSQPEQPTGQPEQPTGQPDRPAPSSFVTTEQAPSEPEADTETSEEAEDRRRELEEQRKEENENYMSFLYNIPGLDNLGQQMLTNQGTDGERQYSAEEYSNWWNGLSDETKSYIRAALTMREKMRSLRSDRGDDTEVRYGQGLINWLALNDGNVASAPNVA